MRRECRERFPRHRLQGKPLVIDPGMHHGTCVTHVPWCMSGSLTGGGGENVPGIPGACATRKFTYLVRDPWYNLWLCGKIKEYLTTTKHITAKTVCISFYELAVYQYVFITFVTGRPQISTILDSGHPQTSAMLEVGNPQTSTIPEEDVSGQNTTSLPRPSRLLLKNAISISVSFMFLFTAFSGLSVLQSSLFYDEGLGVICQAILYSAAILSYLFLAKGIIKRIGHKKTLAFSALGYTTWVAANGYAVWGTMIPTSIIVGLCAGTLWTAKSSYLTLAAAKHATNTGEEQDAMIARFEGVFLFILQLGCKYLLNNIQASCSTLMNTFNNVIWLYYLVMCLMLMYLYLMCWIYLYLYIIYDLYI